LKQLTVIFMCVGGCISLQAQQTPITLNSLVNYGVLGASTVTNSGPTTVNGNLGLSPGTALTGFPPGSITGVYNIANSAAATAQSDLTTAYNDAATANRNGGPVITKAGDLGGQTLAPGLYVSTSSLSIGVGETLTLNGPANGVWVFQMASTLLADVSSRVVLTGGAQAANVFWQVGSSATLNASSIFVGTILAQASVSLGTGAALNGRALARTAAVTLLSNAIVPPGPPVTGGTPPALSVACPGNTAQVSIAFNSAVIATGGTSPYTYSITGTLPPGLTLNTSTGIITGTPTAAGLTSFTVNAADSAMGTANASCGITASVLPATPVPSSLLLGLIGLVCVTLLYEIRERWITAPL
jgi:type VI secretion system secreted protein VgrG